MKEPDDESEARATLDAAAYLRSAVDTAAHFGVEKISGHQALETDEQYQTRAVAEMKAAIAGFRVPVVEAPPPSGVGQRKIQKLLAASKDLNSLIALAEVCAVSLSSLIAMKCEYVLTNSQCRRKAYPPGLAQRMRLPLL